MRYIVIFIVILSLAFLAFHTIYGRSETMRTEDIIKNAMKGMWQLEEIIYPSGNVVKPPEAKVYVCITNEYIFISELSSVSEGKELTIWCHVWRYKIEGTRLTIMTELRGERWPDGTLTRATDTQTHIRDVKLDGEKVEFQVPLTPSIVVFDGDTATFSYWETKGVLKRVERF